MKKQLIFLQILFFSLAASTEELSFDSVWQIIKSQSKKQQASQLEIESNQIAYERSKNHWLPKLQLQARTYQTNDAANSFIGLLEQRSLQQNDFSPDLINHPETKTYSEGILSLDLPLYEGYSKTNLQKISSSSVELSQYSLQQVEIQQYSEISVAYASLMLLNKQKQKLTQLQNEIDKILKNYQLGNKSNPVGYSALLAIKSLINKLNAFKNQIDLQSQSYINHLNQLGLSGKTWTPQSLSTIAFIEKYLSAQDDSEDSLQVKKMKAQLTISRTTADLTDSIHLPRLGAFAETHVFNGSKSTANNYTAGLYVQWNLFAPEQMNLKKESLIKANSLEKRLQSTSEDENYEKKNLAELIETLKQNNNLLRDSENNLAEQTQITLSLFKNGSVNALQVADVFNRRAEVIQQQTEIESSLINAAVNSIQKRNFKINF